jgi:adenylate cyclase
VGKAEDAIELLERAIRLNPNPPLWYFGALGSAYQYAGRYKDAIATYKRVLKRDSSFLMVQVGLASSYSLAGYEGEARATIQELLKKDPELSIKSVRALFKRRPYKDESVYDYLIEALRKAGLPEKPPLQLPEKPSIAVLPFTNISGDPEQEYFADGMADDLITDLSKISGLFVIARNSTFVYKGKAVKIQEVGRELGVQYVLEGSVRKAGDRVRINAQLIEAATGHHIWANRFDRDLEDVFAVQDEVTNKIVEALAVKLVEGEQEMVTHEVTDSLEAYDLALRGWALFRRFSKEENIQARKLFEKALEFDPEYGGALAGLVWTKLTEWNQGWAKDAQVLDEAFDLAEKAVALDETLPESHVLLGDVYLWRGQHDQAKAEFERAVALNPNNAWAIYSMGSVMVFLGKPEEALGFLHKAMRLNPNYPEYYSFSLGQAYFHLERYDQAVSEMKRALIKNKDFFPAHVYLAASYGHLGEEALARAEAQKIMGHSMVSGDAARPRIPYKDEKDFVHLSEGLRKAGLP